MKQQDKRGGDSPVSGMNWNLQDASCCNRAETLFLYIFLFFLFLLINLKFLRKVFILYLLMSQENLWRIFERVRISALKRGAAFGSASHFFFNFQHGQLYYHSVYDIKQLSPRKLCPKFARWSVYLKQKQEKLTISTLCSKRCKLNMAVFSFLPAWVTILLYMVRFFHV